MPRGAREWRLGNLVDYLNRTGSGGWWDLLLGTRRDDLNGLGAWLGKKVGCKDWLFPTVNDSPPLRRTTVDSRTKSNSPKGWLIISEHPHILKTVSFIPHV